MKEGALCVDIRGTYPKTAPQRRSDGEYGQQRLTLTCQRKRGRQRR